jgi:hypothetical protein
MPAEVWEKEQCTTPAAIGREIMENYSLICGIK